MFQRSPRRLLLITDDEFVAEALEMYLRGDGINVVRAADDGMPADAVLADLSKRGINGDAIIALAFRAQRAKIPLFVMSAQPRRDVTEFAAVVGASDVVSKTERMSTIAARLRMWINAEREEERVNTLGFVIPELAASA